MPEHNENQLVPFGQQRSLMAVDPAAVAAGEQAKAMIQAAYIMAAQKPRNVDDARSRILRMCDDPEFAEKVEYAKPVGGKQIKDLSIRFAEMALAYYENISSRVEMLYDDDTTRRIRITVIDLQTNTQFSRDVTLKKTIERKSKVGRDDDYVGERKNSYGETVYILRATDDEMLIKESAMASKFIRTEGLRLLPAGIKEEAKARARQTLAKRDREDPNAAKKKLLDAFTGINIWPRDLEKYLGHNVDTISASEIADLRSVYSAIDSGEANWSDYINREKPEFKPKTPAISNIESRSNNEEKQTESEQPEIQNQKPETSPQFQTMIKKETGKDFKYVQTKNGIAYDNLSAYLELVCKNQQGKIDPYELMENVSDEGIFPGFWNGFIAGNWKKHFVGILPENAKPKNESKATEPKNKKEKEKEPEKVATSFQTFSGHRTSPEGPPGGVSIGGNKKEEEKSPNPFDQTDWSASGLKAKGTQGYWDQYKDRWDSASVDSKKSFEAKWLRVFTKDGELTVSLPWMTTGEPESDIESDQTQPEREPGDDSEFENNEQETKIDYRAKLAQLQTENPELLIKACEAVGYGANLVIPMSEKAQKGLYEKCLELKG